MTARKELMYGLWDNLVADEKNRLIDAYAHELAEQIRRAYSGDEPDHSWVNNPFDAADLIDPDTKGGTMNERTHLYSLMSQAGINQDVAQEAIDAYAHELAEKIRDGRPQWGSMWRECDAAADLIEPDTRGER